MSNSLAVAAVTATLQHILREGLKQEFGSSHVTTKPPDRVRGSTEANDQVNLYLYHVSYDAAWLNRNMPNQAKPFEAGFPPLPLVLHYLVTAYADGNETPDVDSQKLLGTAMRVLHDHPLLGPEEIRAALPNNDLGDQIERVRISPQPLSLEEVSKMWASFQTNYRVSAAYQVSVVLIESKRQGTTSLPVLKQGKDDSGVQSQPGVIPPFPALTKLYILNDLHLADDLKLLATHELPEKKQPSARPGDTIAFEGFKLDGTTVTAQFKHRHLPDVTVPVMDATATTASVKIPDNQPQLWAPGTYSVSLLIQRGDDQDRTTNELPFALAPVIAGPLPKNAVIDADQKATVTLNSNPLVLPQQRALLLLSDEKARQVAADARTAAADPLVFVIADASPSSAEGFYIRLRVDGVDSLLVTDYEAKPPQFDPTQKVVIT